MRQHNRHSYPVPVLVPGTGTNKDLLVAYQAQGAGEAVHCTVSVPASALVMHAFSYRNA